MGWKLLEKILLEKLNFSWTLNEIKLTGEDKKGNYFIWKKNPKKTQKTSGMGLSRTTIQLNVWWNLNK